MASLSGFKFLLKTPTNEVVAKQNNIPNLNTFSTIGGFQSNALDFSATEIDVTNKSSGENRELLNRQGILSISASGSGILQDEAIAKAIEVNVEEQDLRWFALEREDGRTFIARFKLS